MREKSVISKTYRMLMLLLIVLSWGGAGNAVTQYQALEETRQNNAAGAMHVDQYTKFKPLTFVAGRSLGYFLRSIHPSYLGAYGLGQVLDQNVDAINAHLKATRQAIANTDNLTTDQPVTQDPLSFMTATERKAFDRDLTNLEYLLGSMQSGTFPLDQMDRALEMVVIIENRINELFAMNGKAPFFLSEADLKNYTPVVLQDGQILRSKEPCSNVNKSYELSNGKSYAISTLKNSLKKKDASIAELRKKIEKGSLEFHGKVPPKSNYPVSKQRYEVSIKKYKEKLQTIASKGDDYVFVISRAPTPGEWGHSKTALEKAKRAAQEKLTKNLSASSRDSYSKKVAHCDVMMDRWDAKKSEVIAEYKEKIAEMKKMIRLWEEIAQETLDKRLDERQHILNLMAEHPCG
ncbi:MAG: hypothetical protein EOL87_09945 [Spartobacteria bacterium]|nr:hypothetical protein [Spartobacteria bacterium]